MKAALLGMGVLILAAGMSVPARAQEPVGSYPMYEPVVRPNAFFDTTGCCGHGQCYPGYGPACAPAFPPYGGIGPQAAMGMGGMGGFGGPQFRVHPFVRSPRDYWMMGD
jgi:hypothetical protein